MTYAELLEKLKGLTLEQLNCDATIHIIDIDEYYTIKGLDFADEDYVDVLDEDHPFLYI